MLKALLKKQLQEFFSGFFLNSKTGKSHTKGSKVGFGVLFCILIFSFLSMFFSMAFLFSPVLGEANSWIYFAVFAVLATLFGIFGSVFLTYNTLYEAKDNDLLLSMPIPPARILFSRMAGLYVTTFSFEALVMLPAVIVYLLTVSSGIISVVCIFLNLFILPLFALSIACALGWVIALFASKLRNKGIVTVIISIAFFGVYYFFAMRLNTIINSVIENSEAVGEWIRTYLKPIYYMSLGCTGEIVSYLYFVILVLAVFLIVYKILSLNFIKLATAKKGIKKKVYKEKKMKSNSSKAALLKKEFLYFKSTPAYMLNCGLGSVLLIVFSVFAVIKGTDLFYAVSVIGFSVEQLPVLCTLIICFIASTNNITSPSISLEAKNLWLLKSLPVDVKDIFFGKIMLHITVTCVPLVIADIICGVVFDADVIVLILSVVFGIAFVILCALSGLILNIIFPKLDWTNETIPIKQSMSSFIGMFLGLFYNIIIILMFFLTSAVVPPVLFLGSATLVITLLCVSAVKWISTKGVIKFLGM